LLPTQFVQQGKNSDWICAGLDAQAMRTRQQFRTARQAAVERSAAKGVDQQAGCIAACGAGQSGSHPARILFDSPLFKMHNPSQTHEFSIYLSKQIDPQHCCEGGRLSPSKAKSNSTGAGQE
jgi:hypothetical protein